MADRRDDHYEDDRLNKGDGITGSGSPAVERKDPIDLSQPNGEIVDKIEMVGNPTGGSKD